MYVCHLRSVFLSVLCSPWPSESLLLYPSVLRAITGSFLAAIPVCPPEDAPASVFSEV